jgi:hypothetical protein
MVARRLVTRWASFGARLLVPRDFSERGWQYQLDAKGPSQLAAGGRRFASGQIGGVLVRLPRISADELRHIATADREYVATEVTAFLAVWLTSLSCPVLNRPAPDCLFGSNWRPEHWLRLAAQAGLVVRPVRRQVPSTAVHSKTRKGYVVTLTVVANRCFGTADKKLKRRACQLAKAGAADLLAVHFDGPDCDSLFLGADPNPDLLGPDVRDAVLEQLTTGPAGRRFPVRVTS